MEIYSKPRYVQVRFDDTHHVIVFDWVNFSIGLEDSKLMHRKALDMAKQKNCLYYIAETSNVRSALSQEAIKWWAEEWMPVLVEAGLKAIVTVVPSSALANLSTKSWQATVASGITMKNVKTLDEAVTYIKTLR